MQRGMLAQDAEDLAASLNTSTIELFHQCSSSRSNVGSTLAAEALAVKAGLKAARLLGLRKLTVRSDFKSLVMAISNNEKIVEAQGVLFDIC